MSTLGDTLRGERLRLGLTPSQVAAQIKITSYLVEAMESGRFDRLPGGAYRRSFLRQYARIVGVDENEIVTAFKQQYGDPEVPLPTPPAEHHIRPWGLLWMLLATLACAGAYRILQEDRVGSPRHSVANVPVQQAGMAAGMASRAQAPAPAPQPAPEPPPATDAAQPVRVAFTPNEPVWISVQCDGTESFRGTIEGPGTREFGASKKMTIVVGNAGGLTASFNGHPIGPIGARGEVQVIEVTAQGARVVPRKRATPTATAGDSGAS